MRLLAKFRSTKLGPRPRNPLRTGRQPLHADGFPLVLLFSQKAGCSSLVKWFFYHVGKLEEARSYNPWVHHYRTRVFVRQPGYEKESARLFQSRERPIVKLVRNPYDRAVSSFIHTVLSAQRKTEPHWELALVRAARKRAGKPMTEPLSLSFHDFMDYLAATGVTFDIINGHVAKQYVPEEEGRVSRVIKLENFEADIRQMEEDFGLKESPLSVITRSRHHVSGPFDAADHPHGGVADLDVDAERIKSWRMPRYSAFYDDRTRALVRTTFRDDFEHYGYGDAVPEQV